MFLYIRLTLVCLVLGCAQPEGDYWAVDSIWLDVQEDTVHGFHSWQIYAAEWATSRSPEEHLCSVVTELGGVPDTHCLHCETHWTLTHNSVLHSDCTQQILESANWIGLSGVGISLEPSPSLPNVELDEMGAWVQWSHSDTWDPHGIARQEPNIIEIESPWAWKGSH